MVRRDENTRFSREIRRHNEEKASLMDQIDELNRPLTAARELLPKYDQALKDKERAVREEKDMMQHWRDAEHGAMLQWGT